MTSTEPMTYKPGAELNEKLALALGWYKEYDEVYKCGFWQSNTTSFSTTALGFSTTWEGMKVVVEEMQRRGWGFTLQRWGHDETGDHQYEATFGFLGDKPGATADTAPHAVCLAALSALQHVSKEMDKND